MHGRRMLGVGILVFAFGVAAAIVGMDLYRDAYAWVAHTYDVRLVIGRAIVHSGPAQGPSCDELRVDIDELARLTVDNPIQQERIQATRANVALLCSQRPAPALIDQLAELDAAELTLIALRRERLARTWIWALAAFVASMLGAIALVLLARSLQRRALRNLVDSEDRFRMLAANATDLIRIHDADGQTTYASPSSERLLGYTPDEMVAMSPIVQLGHPDDLEKMLQTLTNIREPHAPGSTLSYRLRTKDGSYRSFETHTDPVRDSAGNLVRFYTTARDITDRLDAERRLAMMAVTDELTGLLNRRGFTMIAGQEYRVAMRQRVGVAMAFADVDGLKAINDDLGHELGDGAICQLAGILRATFRESDVVARLGGDEFAAFIYDVDQARVDVALERVRRAIAASNATSDLPFRLSVSLGVSVLAPGVSRPFDELVAEADQRMLEHKRSRGVARAGVGATS